MSGNVLEWCWDWFGIYPGAVTDPAGAETGRYRVGRGGSWSSHAQVARAAFRFYEVPGFRYYIRYDFLGLRLARSLP
ncbi:MAG: SUMF1/EgtB/PvdO family nonheme iron enzyme [Deltaproteobacteria bacterium]|nr:SUMF1/EgtB/PvdO family nonheme iron enzyme [Deltaproteobacteria bacterium]